MIFHLCSSLAVCPTLKTFAYSAFAVKTIQMVLALSLLLAMKISLELNSRLNVESELGYLKSLMVFALNIAFGRVLLIFLQCCNHTSLTARTFSFSLTSCFLQFLNSLELQLQSLIFDLGRNLLLHHELSFFIPIHCTNHENVLGFHSFHSTKQKDDVLLEPT